MAKTVTIRLLDGKEQVYDLFKKTVTEQLHSDVCYVTTMLMESFNQAITQMPNPDQQLIMRFVKQSIQINMGCTFQYYTKKARRTPQDETSIITDKHNLLPEVTNQYQNLSKEAREFWLKEFQEEGIIPPTVSTPTLKTKFIKKLKGLWSIVRQLFS
jgi:hypothetical protein